MMPASTNNDLPERVQTVLVEANRTLLGKDFVRFLCSVYSVLPVRPATLLPAEYQYSKPKSLRDLLLSTLFLLLRHHPESYQR